MNSTGRFPWAVENMQFSIRIVTISVQEEVEERSLHRAFKIHFYSFFCYDSKDETFLFRSAKIFELLIKREISEIRNSSAIFPHFPLIWMNKVFVNLSR